MHNRGNLAMRIGMSASSIVALGALIGACGGGSTGGLGTGTPQPGAGGSSSGGSSSGGAAGSTGTGTGGMAVTGTCSGTPPMVMASGTGTACGCVQPKNHEICPAGVPTPAECKNSKQRPIESCGVLMNLAASGATPAELVRTKNTKEYSDPAGGPVDTSCFDKSNWPTPGTPAMVTVTGWARNFANGCDAAHTKVEIYKVKRGGADDGALGDLVGTAVNIQDTACTADSCKMVVVQSKCDMGNPRIWRKYTYANVPTETELIIKTSSADGSNGFATLYDYNNYILTSQVSGGMWEHDVRVINIGDYSLIPTTAIGRTLTPGNGVVAGEVHDCSSAMFPDGVRLSGASVDVSSPRDGVGYFTDVEDAPLPDPGRTAEGTSSLGLYAAYDIKPGPIRVSATGVVKGELVTLGYYDVRIFPDAVTGVTLRGLRPFQTGNAGK